MAAVRATLAGWASPINRLTTVVYVKLCNFRFMAEGVIG